MHVSLAFPSRGIFGASRSWDPNYAYDAYTDVRAFPFTPPAASAMVAPWMDANLASLKTVSDMRAASVSFSAAIKANTQYATDMRAYYDMRVTRTSGGKRDRMREERAAIQDGVDRANKILSAAMAQVDALAEAKAKSALAVNPDALVRQQNPETGEVFYAPTAPQGVPAQGSSSPASYMLPLAAVAAAYFALK